MKIIQNMTLRSINYWMSWKTAKKRKLLMRWSGPSQYNRSLPLKLHFLPGWDGNLLNLSEKITLEVSTRLLLFLYRTVHQWLIARIPMGRWVRIPFRSLAIRKTTLAILFITVGMRGYLRQTIIQFPWFYCRLSHSSCWLADLGKLAIFILSWL